MGYRHDRNELLAVAMDIALTEGVSAVNFGRVAKKLGISDRMVVYYFPNKTDLINTVVFEIGLQLQTMLESAFGPEPLEPLELMRRAWPVLSTDAVTPMFDGFFEIIGLASVGKSPYNDLAPLLLNGWIEWLVPRVKSTDPVQQRAIAASVVAQLDGLLMVRRISGANVALLAAQAMGIAPY
jgi:AcrR family transcriptional regulator